MRTINPFQLEQKKFDTIDLPAKWANTIGHIPKNIHMIVFGNPGNGKTEFVMQFVKVMCSLGLDVDWISYEQGHGMDLQKACRRNNMIEVKDHFQISDPDSDREDNVSYFEELENKVKKRSSCDIFVIDSVQYTRFTFEDYKHLKTRYKKKSFIWISHREGREPKGSVAKSIEYDGSLTLMVEKFIAYPVKNRFEAWEPLIIYEERARLLNPKFFLDREKEAKKNLFSHDENAKITHEQEGVAANE